MAKLAIRIAAETRNQGLYKVESDSIYNQAAKLAAYHGMIREYSQDSGMTVYRSVK